MGVRHIHQTEEEPPSPLFFESPQLLFAGFGDHGIGTDQQCLLQLVHSCLGVSEGRQAHIGVETFLSPTFGTVSKLEWTFPHLVPLPQGYTLAVIHPVAGQFD